MDLPYHVKTGAFWLLEKVQERIIIRGPLVIGLRNEGAVSRFCKQTKYTGHCALLHIGRMAVVALVLQYFQHIVSYECIY